MKLLHIFILIPLLTALPTYATDKKGYEIALKVDQANSGWQDEEVESVMTLKNKRGADVTRKIRTRSLEGDDEGDKTLVIFDEPRDLKGTVFLTHTHKTGADDQWLFLPSIKRVKRISSSNRSGPFMGSEFAYEDISSEEIERYTYHYLKESSCGNKLSCHVYEKYPVDKHSGYTKLVVYADKEFYRIHKVEYYDRKGEHLKTLLRKNYQKFNTVWRASLWEMTNHLKQKATYISWKNRRFINNFSDKDFNQNSIKKYR